MREGWQDTNLGDVCMVVAGQSPKGSAYNNAGEGLPFHQGKKHFGEVSLGDSNTWTTQITKEAFPGDILMSVRAPVGPINVTNQHMCIGRGLAAIRVSEKLDRMFVFHWLSFKQGEIQGNEGAVFASISKQEIENICLPLPPLDEQKRIVAFLNEAFAGIATAVANTEKNLANARELFESYLCVVFNRQGREWKQLTLKEVCKDYGRGKSKHRPRNDPKLYGGKYPFIQTGDVRHSDHLIVEFSTTYNDVGLAQSKLWPKGTICITIAANIAETGVLDFDACFPDSIIGLVVNESIASGAYVEFLLQSVKTILKAKGKGSAQDNINLGTFEQQHFPFPDLATQQQIVENVQELRLGIRNLESIYQQKLTALAELKQSLLQKAFSGELTADKPAASHFLKAEEAA